MVVRAKFCLDGANYSYTAYLFNKIMSNLKFVILGTVVVPFWVVVR